VLKDEEKRAKYDEGGLEGLEGGDMPEGADDLFSALFGGRRRGGGRPSAPRKGPDVKHPLKVRRRKRRKATKATKMHTLFSIL